MILDHRLSLKKTQPVAGGSTSTAHHESEDPPPYANSVHNHGMSMPQPRLPPRPRAASGPAIGKPLPSSPSLHPPRPQIHASASTSKLPTVIPDPPPTVNQVHLVSRGENMSGVFYIDPKIPSLSPKKKKRCKRGTAPPCASFQTRSGDISLHLATTGNIAETPKANVVVSSRTGNVEIKLLPTLPTRPRIGVDTSSRSGNVTLWVPETFSGVIQLNTRKGELHVLPKLFGVVKVLKETEKEAILLMGTQAEGDLTDLCQLSSRSGKVIIGLSEQDKHPEKTGFWKKLSLFLRGYLWTAGTRFLYLHSNLGTRDLSWTDAVIGIMMAGGREIQKRGHSLPKKQKTAKKYQRRTASPCSSSSLSQEKKLLDSDVESYSPCCDFGYAVDDNEPWLSSEQGPPPSYFAGVANDSATSTQSPAQTIEDTVDSLNTKLRELSMNIHSHPELMFEEKYAHDLLTEFMSEQGFTVTRHYLGLSTAWRAEYSFGSGGRVVGINSEMDALRGMGHACGHNLIAVSGVGVALALKAAMDLHRTAGKVILLGTPAEEAGGGKVILLERGGYKEMDVCIMCHPSPGSNHSASIGPTIAMQAIDVQYFGHSAHAGAAPWEGTNALDAAFLAYSGISLMRQQMKPEQRIHGIIQGKDWSPNVIPDYSKMRWLVRATTFSELSSLVKRAEACFEAAALATSCRAKVEPDRPYYDLQQNGVLGQCFADIVGSRYGVQTTKAGTTASTDFGNVSYALPALHPAFAIPTAPQGGNHTPAFAKAAATPEAHEAMLLITKGLALTGYRILSDSQFLLEVQADFLVSTQQRNA